MLIKKLSIMIFLIILPLNTILSQVSGIEKFQEMKNAFILGLPQKGLEISVELLSLKKYSNVREDVVFYIADFFLLNALRTENKEETNKFVNKAYTYYIVYQNDYPNSKFSKIVNSRVEMLKSLFQDRMLIRDMNDYLENENAIVKNKLDFVKTLFYFPKINPYTFFLRGLEDLKPIGILDRYFDEIIVNHPDFKVYGFYGKIISRLSMFENVNFVKDGIIKFDVDKLEKDTNEYEEDNPKIYKVIDLKNNVNKLLDSLNINYPHHPITLNLHLIIAKVFMSKTSDGYDYSTKKHLEYVLQNEVDKTSPRYMFAREFLLDHNFAEK